MDDIAKKKALQDILTNRNNSFLDEIRALEAQRAQGSRDWRQGLYDKVGGWQDKLTSDPSDTIMGPALATGLGMALESTIANPAEDTDFAGAAPSPPSMRKIDQEKALELLKSIRGYVPDSLDAVKAKRVLEALMKGDKKTADAILKDAEKMDAQALIKRDPHRSDKGMARVQPEPKIEPAKRNYETLNDKEWYEVDD